MKPPFRERWLFAAAVWAQGGRRYHKALERLEALAALRPLKLHEQALKATLLLRTGAPDPSHALFLEVREAAIKLESLEARYLRRYAQYWLAMIRWDPFDAERERREATALDCEPRLKRLLWLPAGEPTDPLDAEFDAWLKANPPGQDDLRQPCPKRPRS